MDGDTWTVKETEGEEGTKEEREISIRHIGSHPENLSQCLRCGGRITFRTYNQETRLRTLPCFITKHTQKKKTQKNVNRICSH